ncbi:MAG: hypothetical protein DRI84_00265 [Bacteroidetes bacterium]|nr:MAG: hypothetical protein DRI84_00265 [Bacteroidota bacterium]
MKKVLIIVLIVFTAGSLYAQQEALYTHYMYNTLAVNPAYAGTRGALTVTALHRSQWVGFEGAPTTQTLTLHTPLRNRKIGLGISVINDVIGPDRNTGFYVDYSYKLRINKNARLALGLKAGISVLKSNLGSILTADPDDPVYKNDVKSQVLPNFGFGMYYYTDNYYVGVSIPRLLENDYSNNSIEGSGDILSGTKHYYLIAGAAIDLSDNFQLRPTTLIKMSSSAPIEIDLTAMFVYDNRFSMGIMGRSGDAVGLLVGVNILPQLEIGYSFDWSFTNETHVYNGGSHEIFIRYDFIYKTTTKIHSPRYF